MNNYKTDDASKAGIHAFENAGLGKAPYIFKGVFKIPGGCDFCGQGLVFKCLLTSSEGKNFCVGSDCLQRAGDSGLTKLYKTHQTVRELNRQKAIERDRRVVEEWKALMANETACEKLRAFTVSGGYSGVSRSWLDFAKTAWGYCGMAGHARYLKAAKDILSGKAIPASCKPYSANTDTLLASYGAGQEIPNTH